MPTEYKGSTSWGMSTDEIALGSLARKLGFIIKARRVGPNEVLYDVYVWAPKSAPLKATFGGEEKHRKVTYAAIVQWMIGLK